MVINGVETDDDETHDVAPVQFPKMVKNRVAHIDADFIAYQSSYIKKGETKSLDDMKYNAEMSIKTITALAGAEHYVLHLTMNTPKTSDRHKIALLKEYHANRKTEKPAMLNTIRKWMIKELGAIKNVGCEADDSMSETQYQAIAMGEKNRSIICTLDKDLMMVPGLHLDWRTGIITDVKGYGKIWLDEKQVLRGYGTAFFWAQMLKGDPADNISGIPGIGDKKAFELLDGINNDLDAYTVVHTIYLETKFVNYRTKKKLHPNTAFLSEAKLLWMRRNKNRPDDVCHWLDYDV